MNLLTTIFGLICDGVKVVASLTAKSDLEKAVINSNKKADSESNIIHDGNDVDEINRIFGD
jgi:hypothetical protein